MREYGTFDCIQIELDYPFHRAYAKGGEYAVDFQKRENYADKVQKHDGIILVQLIMGRV